jgi:hypothetical protein
MAISGDKYCTSAWNGFILNLRFIKSRRDFICPPQQPFPCFRLDHCLDLMGNSGSSIDGTDPATTIAQKNLSFFDHAFKGELHTVHGDSLVSAFGECAYAKRPITLNCKSSSMEVEEEIGITACKKGEIQYSDIKAISWDHGKSEVKFELVNGAYVIFAMANSIELEGEMKLRLSAAAATNRSVKIPQSMYIGMFAGATKPKPFQRKRPNLSKLPAGRLPSLVDMRNQALDLHKGSYQPCSATEESRRKVIALQHIYEGKNTFGLINCKGSSIVTDQFRPDSELVISDEGLTFRPTAHRDFHIDFPFDEIVVWDVIDNEHLREHDSGIEIVTTSNESIYFGVHYIRDVKHTLEYFWNIHKTRNGDEVKLGSTHGRPIVSVCTLSGDAPPATTVGQTEVVDQDGCMVRPGAKIVPRRSSIVDIAFKEEVKIAPPENREVKSHWHNVVMHQGWLLKQGGVGVGNTKSWIKRYFVLYKTSQGHFLVYYSDFTECPLYTSEKNHRNIVDLAKATFIRPGSNRESADTDSVPPHSFDIVTIEREWTLCAENQETQQKWLKLINQAVDEDVAILPDEELLFSVKPKVDPKGVLCNTDYSTTLKVSANGICVTTPNLQSEHKLPKLHCFWVYTDFYKWSLLSQGGKLALLVNVFSDSTFSQRDEYVFRNKDAVRLATAIEYFIEKFMSVMHIRMETTPGAFDAVADTPLSSAPSAPLHVVSPEDTDETDIMDLLGMDMDSNSPIARTAPTASTSNGTTSGTTAAVSLFGSVTADPFGDDDPFGDESTSPMPSASQTYVQALPVAKAIVVIENSFDSDDPFGMDFAPAPAPAPVRAPKPTPVVNSFSDDPFGMDFAPAPAAKAVAPIQPKAVAVVDSFADDPFGLDLAPAPAPVRAPVPTPVVNSFSDDPFGLDLAPAPAPVRAPKPTPVSAPSPEFSLMDLMETPAAAPTPAAKVSNSSVFDVFSDDPFSSESDPFASKSDPFAAKPPKIAPPLNPQQISQHKVWMSAAVAGNGGLIYDDGALQVSTKLELRGSQCRLTFYYTNIGVATIQDMSTTMHDPHSMTRFDMKPLASSTIPALGKSSQLMLLECMKPTPPGPSLTIEYVDSLMGKHSNTVNIPVIVTSFNEPLALSAQDFTSRWALLTGAGQQAQEVMSLSYAITPAQIAEVFTKVTKFGLTAGMPDSSEFVLYGASSLKTGSTNPKGEKINIGCMAKIEMNLQSRSVRLTLRTLHPMATQSILETIKILFN